MKSFKSFTEAKEKKKQDLKSLPASYIGLDADGKTFDESLVELPPGYVGLRNVDALLNPEVKEEVEASVTTTTVPNNHSSLKYDGINVVNDLFRRKMSSYSGWEPSSANHHSPNHAEEHQELEDHVAPEITYTGEMGDHVRNYTSDSRGLNRYLLDKHKGHIKTPNPSIETATENLTKAAFIKPLHRPLVGFAGVGAANPGQHPKTILPAFSSMSTSAEVAAGFARQDSSLLIHEHPHIIVGRHIGKNTYTTPQIMHPDDVAAHHGTYGGANIPTAQDLAGKYGIDYNSHAIHIRPLKHVIRAEIPQGTPMIVPGSLSQHQHEREFILPPGAVMERHPTKLPDVYACGTIVHHVKITHPEARSQRSG